MIVRKYHKDGTLPKDGEFFVFGSNLSGIHGAGAAKVAYNLFGTPWGQGEGAHINGNYKSYAIATKDHRIETLPMEQVCLNIDKFVSYTESFPHYKFFVTRIGCGLAGFKDEQIAPLFAGAKNCSFAEQWKIYLD